MRAAEQDRPDVAVHRKRWKVYQRFMDGAAFVFIDETSRPFADWLRSPRIG